MTLWNSLRNFWKKNKEPTKSLEEVVKVKVSEITQKSNSSQLQELSENLPTIWDKLYWLEHHLISVEGRLKALEELLTEEVKTPFGKPKFKPSFLGSRLRSRRF